MIIKKVILTVPHSVCIENDDRIIQHCDIASLDFASKLQTKLDLINIDCEIIESDQNRTEFDDNRYDLPDIDKYAPSPIDNTKQHPIFEQTNFNETSNL